MRSNRGNGFKLKAGIFYALSDPVRLEIIDFLREGEKCVCEIVLCVGLIQPVVSRHLKILKGCGLLRCKKKGNRRLYSVADLRVFKIIDTASSDLVDALTKRIIEQMA